MQRLQGRTVFVTGAASGIGKAQALRFAEEGARIVVADLDRVGAERAAQEIVVAGGRAIGIGMDVTDVESIAAAVRQGLDEYGVIDTLSNTAGYFDNFTQLADTDRALFDKVMDINVTGIFSMTKALLPHMLENGKGVILNIASAAGLRGGGGGIGYTTSKHAVIGFTRQLAAAYGSRGIRANAIAPGLIDTAMVADFSRTEKLLAKMAAKPAGRMGRVEDVANAALFLVSDEADFIHATTLCVDGGGADTF
jgi:3-oxoacyl-[acyl-carrier protein] reductase